jgi:tetratricopeptide (TPR) repeat protein
MWLAIVLLGSHGFGATSLEDFEAARDAKDWPRVVILLKKSPTLVPDAAKWLTLAYLKLGRREEALRELGTRTDRTLWKIAGEQYLSDESEGRTNAAVQAMRNDRLDLALQELAEALKIDPKHPLILARMGQALLLSGRREEATDVLRSCVHLHPFLPQAKWLLGRALWLRGSKAEARPFLESILKEKDPPDWALLWITDVLQSEGLKKKETAKRLKKVLSRPEDFVTQSNRREAKWNFFNPTHQKAADFKSEFESLLKQPKS